MSSILVKFLGKPPKQFSWEYLTKDNKFNRIKDLTPQSFYKDIIKNNLDDYISIINMGYMNVKTFQKTFYSR